MEVPVIKIKETGPDKSEEKLIKSIILMVCHAIKHMWLHAACYTSLGLKCVYAWIYINCVWWSQYILMFLMVSLEAPQNHHFLTSTFSNMEIISAALD